MTVDQFIDPVTRSWREIPLRQHLVPEDVNLVLGLRIARISQSDKWGWHFSKSGRYNVKSGYRIEETHSSRTSASIGPNLEDLQAQAWKFNCPGKIKNFMWQAISGCVAVNEKLRSRGIHCDTGCARCGEDGESINHVLFECPPARQTWALSNVPSPISQFPRSSIWYNMDYLFWRVSDQGSNSIFPWILWNLWKARNDKVFSNINRDPREILKQAALEAEEWTSANLSWLHKPSVKLVDDAPIWREVARPLVSDSSFTGFRCFVDGAWKDSDVSSGIAWVCFSDSVEAPFCGGRSIPRSISAIHAEFEAILWAMECLLSMGILEVEMGTDSSNILKMISIPEDWPAFAPFLEDFSRLKGSFSCFSLHVIPRFLNHRADFLARSFRL